jgi:hypothetical protein
LLLKSNRISSQEAAPAFYRAATNQPATERSALPDLATPWSKLKGGKEANGMRALRSWNGWLALFGSIKRATKTTSVPHLQLVEHFFLIHNICFGAPFVCWSPPALLSPLFSPSCSSCSDITCEVGEVVANLPSALL